MTMERRFGWDAISFLTAVLLLQQQLGLVTSQKPKSSPWLTLTGDAPAIIAKGGFSGIFPDSGSNAYTLALITSSSNTILWCDVRLTKDSVGICLPDLRMDNCTDIQTLYPDGKKVYSVNGVPTPGWFSIDYNMSDLSQVPRKVPLIRSIGSRTQRFDYREGILGVEDVNQLKPPGLWLNIQNDIFYTQHKLNMRSYLLSVAKRVIIGYVSSPEVAFLRGISPRFAKSKTELVFRFLGEDITEPSTNQTYASLLENLTFIKTFASGILVPKHYIWPPTSDNYLKPSPKSVVLDAHKVGLKVYAADFANDAIISYNYSYDPLAEYLNFIDNGAFSVDGVLSDFPITPSEAIGCFSHIDKNSTVQGTPAIISHNGASGTFPDCTDLAYKQAVQDGADFIDCQVQVTKDRILVCMSSINLIDTTTVTKSPFSSLFSTFSEIQSTPGIFTFNLTWDDIKTNLKPTISNPESEYGLVRNPLNKNKGNFMKLSEFLTFAKGQPLSGVLIGVENAAFVAESLGLSVIDEVIAALDDSGYNNLPSQEVMIQSTDSSVLIKFKQLTKQKNLYVLDEAVGDAVASSIADIKKFADAVAVKKQSVYPETKAFLTFQTDLVKKLKSAKLSVFVYVLRNEFISQPWDFFSDPTVEINAYVQAVGVDGIITDFPATVRAYKQNSCLKLGKDQPNYMKTVEPGGLLQIIAQPAQPPALAPMPLLKDSDVVEPPFPAVSPLAIGNSTQQGSPGSQPSSSSGAQCIPTLISLALLFVSLLI